MDLDRDPTKSRPEGAGSGFVWDENGHIVTNFHVIQGGDVRVVLENQKTVPAVVVGVDPGRFISFFFGGGSSYFIILLFHS